MKLLGYERPNGEVGTRNYILLLPTTGCANDFVTKITNKVKGTVPILHHQ